MHALEKTLLTEKSFAKKMGLEGLPFSKLQAARESLNTENHKCDPRTQTALWVVAPCLAAYALWVRAQSRDTVNPCYVGVMREGRLLSQIMSALFDVKQYELWANRDLSLRAAFGAGDDEALLNWLVRTRLHPLTHGEASILLW